MRAQSATFLTLTLALAASCTGTLGGRDAGPPLDVPQPDAGPVDDVQFGLETRPVNTTCVAPERPPLSDADVTVERTFPGLPRIDRPIFLTSLPTSPERFYIVSQGGTITTFTGDGSDASTFVTLEVDDEPSEGGLLGLAFHPDFADNGQVYVSYTAQGDSGFESRLSQLTSNDGLTASPAAEVVLLRQPQFAGNHNGGWIGFGPDGYLYLGLGDGGGGGDPRETGQDNSTWLGAILRLDVDGGDPYAIPPDNPFADGVDGRPEIFAFGVRNPWRMSFDRVTGELWAGDVGQSTQEEINIVPLGGNLGWDVREGTVCYEPSTGCQETGFVDPVATYGRDEGQSVTGGYVYRGSALPELSGVYVFADYLSQTVWGLFEDPESGEWDRRALFSAGFLVSSFGEDQAGELMILNYLGGSVHRIVRNAEGPPDSPFPQRLSETGCMDPDDPSLPGPGLIPYQTIAQLWSDGAEKERWMALPAGETIAIEEDGDFTFPIGTVLIKQFRVGDRLVETRFVHRHPDGVWGGYTYRWNDAQTDADLVATSDRVDLGGGESWRIPSRAQCVQCHTEAAGRSLGLEVAQLNGDFIYPGRQRANQLATLQHIGVLTLPAEVDELDALADYLDEDADLGLRARGYLHSNCSVCHRPGGPGRGDLDLRYDTPLVDTGTCRERPVHGDLGLENAFLIAPGEPERSALWERTRRLDVNRMPPLASEVVDAVGVDLLRRWIVELDDCE